MNALVLTVESQAGGHALGYGDLSLALNSGQRRTGKLEICLGMKRHIRKLKANKQNIAAEIQLMTAWYSKHIICLTLCPFFMLVLSLQLVKLA